MRIIGNSDETLTEVEFQLDSTHMRFKHVSIPDIPTEPWMREIGRETKAIICFDDSKEIDMFVRILEEFQRSQTGYIGEWKGVP
jgi:hypothetical protein